MTALTVRLPVEQAADLALVAACDGESVAEAIRAAVAYYIDRRLSDQNVKDALRRHIERANRLAGGDS